MAKQNKMKKDSSNVK